MSEDREIEAIGDAMLAANLPEAFVGRVLELAKTSEGVEDLVHLWSSAPDEAERREVEAELQGAIEDRERSGPAIEVASVEEGERLLKQRCRQKEHLRRLVAAHGGVSEVARRAQMPQPSLSRLLNSMSEPRPSTLLRLAEAMGLTVSDLAAPQTQAPQALAVYTAEPYVAESREYGVLESIGIWLAPKMAVAS